MTGLPDKAVKHLNEYLKTIGLDIKKWVEDAPALQLNPELYFNRIAYEWSAYCKDLQLYIVMELLESSEWFVVEFQITGD